jgi:hypothetical protein
MSNRKDLINLETMLDYSRLSHRIVSDKRNIKIITNKIARSSASSLHEFNQRVYTKAEMIAVRADYQARIKADTLSMEQIAAQVAKELDKATSFELAEEYVDMPYQYPQLSKIVLQVLTEKLGGLESEAWNLIHGYSELKAGQ